MTQQLEQPVDTLVGQKVADRYTIVKLLGEGGMGCVYLAEQLLGEKARKVAFKTLHKHLSHDPHIKARFKREASTVAGLEHPNTIQIYDFGEMPDGTLYLVMEFVQGRSVADILEKDGPMPPPRVEHILRQVCGSLEEAHGHGIIHRDLKPDNVVLCERAGQKDWVEVLDFGIAKRSSEHDPNEAKLTQQGMVLGTPPYMSPEQFTGQPIDVRSDIYALGVMAYEMLTGRLPFHANTAWEWASKHMTEPPIPIDTQPLGPGVPPGMKAAIGRAMAKNREERFGSVKEFLEAFTGSAASASAVAVAVSAGGPAGGPPRAKTEMAAPSMQGGPPSMQGGPPSMQGGPPMNAVTPAPFTPPIAGAPAVVPAGPAHSPPQKKGGSGVIIGLAGLAVLLLAGAGIGFAVSRKPKPVPTVASPDTPATTTVAASVAASDQPPDHPPVVDVAPLDSSKAAVAANVAGGTAPKATTAKPVPTPQPKTKEPPKQEPEVCVRARRAKAEGRISAQKLENDCRAAGGVP